MNSISDSIDVRRNRLARRLPLVCGLAAVLSLGLGACGRKGPLDPPPSSLSDSGAQPPQAATITASPVPQVFGAEKKQTPPAPAAPNKRIILDSLLD